MSRKSWHAHVAPLAPSSHDLCGAQWLPPEFYEPMPPAPQGGATLQSYTDPACFWVRAPQSGHSILGDAYGVLSIGDRGAAPASPLHVIR